MHSSCFDIHCDHCPRLAGFLSAIRSEYPGYHARPVPAFGDSQARLLIVGLAPGLHGANASGRPFTGDHAGLLLYKTLHKFGFASAPRSCGLDDGLRLIDCRITNAVKCVPPQNKPLYSEIKNCRRYLSAELQLLPANALLLALGRIAHESVLRSYDLKTTAYRFKHGVLHRLAKGVDLLDSYHCSRYNTQTRRLTTPMFEEVFSMARRHLDSMPV